MMLTQSLDTESTIGSNVEKKGEGGNEKSAICHPPPSYFSLVILPLFCLVTLAPVLASNLNVSQWMIMMGKRFCKKGTQWRWLDDGNSKKKANGSPTMSTFSCTLAVEKMSLWLRTINQKSLLCLILLWKTQCSSSGLL